MTNDELIVTKKDLKLIKMILMGQGLMSGLIIFFILLSIFLEIKYLVLFKPKELDYEKRVNIELNSKQMINIIVEQLELIKEQRKENQYLKEQLSKQSLD